MDSSSSTASSPSITMSSHTTPLSHTDPSSDTPDASTILRQFMHQLQQEQQQQFSSSLYGTLQPYRFQPQEFHTSLSSQPPPILGLDDSIQPPPQPSPDLLNDVKPMIRDHMSFDPHDITTTDGDEIVPAIKPRRKRRKKFSPMDEAEAKALRTKKHSEAEVRRRHKFNELLVDLAKMFNCEKSQKIDILKTIISDVESMRAKIAAYEQRHGPLTDEHNDNSDIHESHKQPDTIRSNNTSDIDTTVDTEHNDNNMTLQVGGRISILTMDPAQAQVAATQNMLAAMSQHQRRSQNMQTGPSHDPSMSLVPTSTPSPSPYPPASSSDDPYGIMSQHRQLISPVDHRMLFISSNIAMDVADLSGRIIDCNTHFCELLGYTKSSLLAPSNFFRITHPDSLAHTFAVLSSLLTGGRTAQRSRRKYITRTGMISEVMITCWLTRDHDQQPQYVVEIVEPI